MFSRVSKFAVVAALAFSMGIHWGFLQSAAWVGMVVNYSQDAPLAEALVKTFDGKHPCSLCKQIARGKQTEKKSESLRVGKAFEFVYSGEGFIFGAPSPGWTMRWPECSAYSQTRTPPVPPPRQLPG